LNLGLVKIFLAQSARTLYQPTFDWGLNTSLSSAKTHLIPSGIDAMEGREVNFRQKISELENWGIPIFKKPSLPD
jgi:hypothetical protein